MSINNENENPLGYKNEGKLLVGFAIPCIISMLVTALYNIVDQVFIGQGIGMLGNAATNIAFPLSTTCTAISLLLGIGCATNYSLHLGAGEKKESEKYAGNGIILMAIMGIFLFLITTIFLTPMLKFFGATPDVLPYAEAYTRITAIGFPFLIANTGMSKLILADGSPNYSMTSMLIGAIVNTILDPVFIFVFKMGMTGAALATFLGLLLSFVMGVVYFVTHPNFLHFTFHGLSIKEAFHSMVNGTSEFVNQLAIAITTVVFNRSALLFAGEDGVAAVSIIMYLQFLCIGIYFGFSMGLSTPLGYAYGDRNFSVCRVLEKYAYRFFAIAPIILYGCTYLLAPIGVRFFASPGSTVFDMAVSGLRLYGLGFLFSGINIFAAIRMMTYGKGYISGMITFLRSFALLLLFLTVLPRFLELNGIWLAVPAAEILTLIVALWTLRKKTVV